MLSSSSSQGQLLIIAILCFSLRATAHSLKYKSLQYVQTSGEGMDAHINLSNDVILSSHSRENFPFMNCSLDWTTRVNDLVSRLTIDEIIDQLSHGGADANGPAPPVSRLGIGPFQWTSECLHGYSYSGSATSFPQAINLAAMFDKPLLSRVAEAIGNEARAKFANYSAHGIVTDHTGLNCYSPVINIMRHPFWGRSQETYGEDPSLTGQLAEAFVHGLMGNDSRYFRANAVCKHFAAHNGPENLVNIVDRFSFNAIVPEVDMRMTYLPHFEACIGAGAQGIMCSYNSINGVPACANQWLLTDVLRNEWNFTGFVVSDEGAVEFGISRHHYFSTAAQSAAGSTQNGLNLELSIAADGPPILANLTVAVQQGKIDIELLRERIWPLFYTRMRLGEFDPPTMNPYTKYNLSIIQSIEQKNLSLLAAKRSFILLKWQAKDNLVPIKPKSLSSITLIGPFAVAETELFGDYSPPFDPANSFTVAQGLQQLTITADKLNVIPACSDVTCQNYDSGQQMEVIRAVAQEKQLVVVALGTGEINEREGTDRTSLELPGGQPQILNDVLNVAELSNIPVIVLLFSATAVNITRAAYSPNAVAIYQCGFPAQETGLALFHVLSLADDDSNPAGRLPYTWYRDMTQVPDIIDYDMRNKTYRFFAPDVTPLFDFGFGLSYSQFQYVQFQTEPTVRINRLIKYPQMALNVTLLNIGPYNGDEVVQVYASWPPETLNDSRFQRVPRLQLLAFERCSLKVGEERVLQILVDTKWLRLWSSTQGYVVPSGKFSFYVGGQQPVLSSLKNLQADLKQVLKKTVNFVAV